MAYPAKNNITLLNEIYTEILLENRESKNINLARKYAKSKGYNDEQAQKLIDGIRTDIPNSRLGQCKFLMGITRLFLDNQLSDGSSIQKLNKLLPYITSDTHIKEYDNNINNLSLDEISNKFSSIQQQDAEQSKKNSYSKQHVKNNDYTIVKIPDFKTASKYGEYTSWCVTHSNNMYMNYTNNGSGLFYFCLKHGFENVPKEQGENAPLDEYGLSMIAVSVDEEGEPNTITCRWNHDMEGNDHIMSKDELEDLLGVNFYDVFKPYSKEELKAKGFLSLDDVRELLANGTNPSDVFYEINYANANNWYIVSLHKKYTLYNNKTNKIIDFNKWFDYIDYFNNGFAKVRLNNKWSFIDTNGKLIYNGKMWFDDAHSFYYGFARVKLNNKLSYIDTNGKLIGNGKLWFDEIYNFKNGFAEVVLNDKWSYIDINGKLIGDGKLWFDRIYNFDENGFAKVQLNNKSLYIDTNGKLIGNGKLWFDEIYNFKNGFAPVQLNNKWSFIDANGKLIGNGNMWFDSVGNFLDRFAPVSLNNKYSFIDANGKLIRNGNMWFDYATDFSHGFAIVELNNKWSFIDINGKLIGNGNMWFDQIADFDENGFAEVVLNDNILLISTKGNLYNRYTKQPIPNPFKQNNNENVKTSKNSLLKEIYNELFS